MAKTPQQRVIEKHPNAYCQGYAGATFISFHIKSGTKTLGIGDTVRGAWRAAAAKMRSTSTRSHP